MATNTLIQNIMLPVFNADETPFHGLSLRRFTVESVVMSLGDKITGDVYYPDNNLLFTMQEYVVYNGVKYVMVNPPTIVKEGMVADNSELKGMTKYSLVFYHPMYQLGNMPFSDVAVTSDESRYLSESKKFSWIGKPNDFIAKINKNLEDTQWAVVKSSNFPSSVNNELSDVIPFENATIADALKTMNDTWKIPYVVDVVASTDPLYAQGKRFKVVVGLPAEEIYPEGSQVPYVFRLGSGVGLKNNSRTPRNNKIVTRIAGYGSERNIPYGYPQIIWYGDQTWKYTINNDGTDPLSYPIYDGIVGGKWVKLIKHPFTRTHLMPKVYVERLFNKVSQYAVRVIPQIPSYTMTLDELYVAIDNLLANYTQSGSANEGLLALKETIQDVVADGLAGTYDFGDGHTLQYEGKVVLTSDNLISGYLDVDDNHYPKFKNYTFNDVLTADVSSPVANQNYDPTLELIDYYDAIGDDYPNNINPAAPSYESHEFEDVYPRLNEEEIVSAVPKKDYIDYSEVSPLFAKYIQMSEKAYEINLLERMESYISHGSYYGNESFDTGEWKCSCSLSNDEAFIYFKYSSSDMNFSFKSLKPDAVPPTPEWDDTMNDKGEYNQSYFQMTLPVLSFDVYACASITEQMDIFMRSGDCIGCTFSVQVDWDDYKRNFFDKDGKFCPDGAQRDLVKYPKSNEQSITVIVQKDINTFGTLMPNRYQQPQAGDEFVFLGISLPSSYISTAEEELEDKSKEYMLDNNIYYFDYPVKLSEHFLENHKHILSQIKPNAIMRFEFAGEQKELFIKQVSTKVGFTPLPQYEITLTDNVEVVLNKIGETAERVSRLETLVGMLNQEELKNIWAAVQERLSKVDDDTAKGFIRFMKGLQVGNNFTSGILGEGGVFRMNGDGTSYLEVDKMYVRMKAYFDNVEVKDYQHSSGNRMVTKAGAKICRVEWVDSQGEYVEQLDVNLSQVVKFRCFFKADDGEDTVRNDFVVDANGQQDLVYCNRTVIESGINKRWYWRAAIAKNATMTGEGEAWIDLSVTDCATDSDIPMTGDDIIQLGNRTDADRQGAIVEYVGGEDAPSYQIFQGINTYNLNNKNYISLGYSTQTNRAYMNVYGDAYIGDHQETTFVKYEQVNSQTNRPKLTIKAEVDIQSTFGGQSLQQRVEQYAPPYDDSWIQPAIDAVQAQIDGELDTYYLAGVPSLQLPPVVSTQAHPYDDPWLDGTETAEERQAILNDHVGDLYYDKNTGYVYRFLYDDDNDTFLWTQIHDDAISEALRIANDAQDTADNKRRVFICDASHQTPTPPYDAGDLWVNVKYPWATGATYDDEILKCIKSVPRTEGGQQITTFNINDWSLANGYTSKLNDFVNNTFAPFSAIIKAQVDAKAETWYQDIDPSTAWTNTNTKIEHIGDIWCDTSANGGKKTYIWVNSGTAANPVFEWKEQAVPEEVFDKIDGKADIFVVKPTAYNRNDMWIIESGTAAADMPAGCQAGDIVIADNLPSGTDKRTAFVVGDWRKKDRYTDDTKYNNFITALLNGMPSGSTEATVEAALNAIKAALNQGTTISGGLVLSTLIGLRDSNSVLWAGINGQYDANALGKGIAGWYGGAMADMGNMTDAQIEAWEAKTEAQKAADSSWAKTLFRFDGSGYLAANNIYWNAGGAMTIKNLQTIYGTAGDSVTINTLSTLSNIFLTETYGSFNNTELLVNPQNAFSHLFINRTGNVVTYPSNLKTINDYAVLNFGEMKARFVTVDFFNALFQAKDSSGNTIAVNTANPLVDSIKSLVGFWTESYLSALGQNSSGSGGGGGVDMTTVWTAMGQPTTEQINVTHLSNALSSYSTKLETIQNIAVGTGANVGSYVVTRANGSNFTIGACNVVDIADYESMNEVLPTGNVMYVYEGMPVEYRRCSRRVSQQTTEVYMIFTCVRPNTSSSSYPYPQELYVFKRVSGSSSFIYDETVNWDDAENFIKQLFGYDMYLPLTGGQMSNQSLVEDLNADLLDGYHASAFLLKTGGTMSNTNLVTNLNADLLDGHHSSEFLLLTGGTLTGNLNIGSTSGTGDLYLNVRRAIDRFDSYSLEVHSDSIKFNHTYYDWGEDDDITDAETLKVNSNRRLIYNNNVLAYQSEIPSLSGYFPLTGGTINDNTDTTIDIYSDGLTFKYSGAVVGSISIEQDAGDYYLDISAGTTIGGNTIIHSGNIGSQSVNYATTAGSATDSTKVAKSGDTMTGQLTMSNDISVNSNNSVRFDTDNSISADTYGNATRLFILAYDGIYLGVNNEQQANHAYLDISDNGISTNSSISATGNIYMNSNLVATQTWVGNQGYLTSASLNGYATQTWVNGQPFFKRIDAVTLPSLVSADTKAIYVVPSENPVTGNLKEEWCVVEVLRVSIGNEYVDVMDKGTALGWYPADYDANKNMASRGDVLLHSDTTDDAIDVCEVPYDGVNPAEWGGYEAEYGTAYTIGNTKYVYVPTGWKAISTLTTTTERRWEKIGGGAGGSGTVNQIKVGNTVYNPTMGVVSLPAYPTTLPASDVYAWAKASTKPTYTLDEVSDGTTRKLSNYLPLTGGTLTGTVTSTGFVKTGSSSAHVLTGDGGHASISGLSVAYATSAGAVAWGNVSSKPTTLSGYGITDGLYSTEVYSAQDNITWAQDYANAHTRSFVYNTHWVEWSYLFGVNTNARYGAILKMGYTDRYLRLLRVDNGTWQSSDWEKIYAGYADSAGSVAWTNVSGRPTNVSSFTNDSGYITSSALGSYLPLSGGTMTGTLTITSSNPLIFTATGSGTYNMGAFYANANGLTFETPRESDNASATILPFLVNTRGGQYAPLKAGNIYMNDNLVIHSGNIGSQSVNYANSAGSAASATYATSAGAASSSAYTTSVFRYTGHSTYNVEGESITDAMSSDDLTRAYNGTLYPVFHNTDWGWSDTLYWSGYDKWGGTELATEYNASANVRVKIRKYYQGTSTWGAWTEFITSGNISSQSVSHANTATTATTATYATYDPEDNFLASEDWVQQQGYITSSGSCAYATSAGNADTVDGYHASAFVHHRDNGSSYNNLANVYCGGTNPVYWRIHIPKPDVWCMMQLTFSLIQNHSSGYHAKIIVYGTCYSGANWYAFNARVVGNTNNTIQVYGSDREYIYIYTNTSWETLSLDKAIFSDVITGYDVSAVTIDWVSSLPSTYQTATMLNDVHSQNIGSLNAGSATQLATSRTLWGQSFDGTADISGSITSTGNVTASGYGKFGGVYVGAAYNGGSSGWGCIERAGSGNMLYMQYYHNGGINMCQGGGNVGIGTTSPSYKLDVNGTARIAGRIYADGIQTGYTVINGDTVLFWDGSEIVEGTLDVADTTVTQSYTTSGIYNILLAYTSGTTTTVNESLHTNKLQFDVGTGELNLNGSLVLKISSSPYLNVYFSTGQVMMDFDGIACFNNASGYEFDDTISATGFVNSSDARLKDIYDYNALVDVNSIAMAPAVRYTWKNKNDKALHCGSLAQYWYSVMPECVNQDRNGYLSMQYDVIALLASISIAKKVMNHEERITELEKENERLRTELEQLRLNEA